MTTFSKTIKGQKAKAKYKSLLKDGWSEIEALEILRMHGYSNHFSTEWFV